MDKWQFSKWNFHGATQFTVDDINWKLCLQTYGENYHIPYLHAQSLARGAVGNTLTHTSYGPHSMGWGAERRLKEMIDEPESEWDPWRRGGLQQVGLIYPCIGLVLMRGIAHVFQVLPGNNVEETITHYTRFVDFDLEEHPHLAPFVDQTGQLIQHVIETEDYEAQRTVQAAIKSGATSELVLGKNESFLQVLHRALEEDLARLRLTK